MSTRALPRLRVVVAALALAPSLGVALAASTAVPGAAADADINLIGGAGTSAVVCGNVAEAQQLAQQRHLTLQRSRCTADANGGDVALRDVEIFLPRGGGGGDNNTLARLAGGGGPAAVAADTCAAHRPAGASAGGRQLNECSSIGHGGRTLLDNVTLVNHLAGGGTTSRSVGRLAVALPQSGTAAAACRNIVSDPLKQRDDCDGSGTGASWNLRGVDVISHNGDGSTSTRRGVNVTVRGGDATASTYCFNVTDGSSRVVQINICRANANAGDASLSNVTINTYAG